MPNRVQTYDSERIDRPDFEQIVESGAEGLRQLGTALLTSNNRPRQWILNGFLPRVLTPASAKQVQVPRGVALFGTKKDGAVRYGILTSEGPASKTFDLSSFAVGYYAIWARYDEPLGEEANRVFWDEGAAAEFSQNVQTRRVADWNVTFTPYAVAYPAVPNASTNPPQSPGPEWMLLGTVHITAGSAAVLGQRQLFFEGYEDASYDLNWTDPTGSPIAGTTARGWGSVPNDRDNDRGTWGLRDLQQFANATLKKIEEIQSNTARWWTAPVEPLDRKVSRFGDSTLNGSYTINGAGGDKVDVNIPMNVGGILSANAGIRTTTLQDIGTSTNRFDAVYARSLNLENLAGGVSPTLVLRGNDTTGQPTITLRSSINAANKFDLLYNMLGSNFAALVTDAPLLMLPSGTSSLDYPMALTATEVFPAVDESVRLGTPSLAWSEVHSYLFKVGNTGVVDLTSGGVIGLKPSLPTEDIGQAGTNAFRNAYLSGSLSTPSIEGLAAGGDITVRDSLVPVGPSTTIGVSGNRFNMFAQVLSVAGTATVDGVFRSNGNFELDTANGRIARGTGVSGNPGIFGFKVFGDTSGQSAMEIEMNTSNGRFLRFNPNGNTSNATGTNAPISTLAAAGGTPAHSAFDGSIKINIAGVGDRWIHYYTSNS